MAIAFPTIIPRTRTVNLGDGTRLTRETFLYELNGQSLSDIRAWIRDITETTTAQQIALGNPPQLLEVDNRTGKSLDTVEKKAVVTYGTALPELAMRLVEAELRAAILASTRVYSGRLSDVAASWQWRYIPKGGAARVVTSGTRLASFSPGDMLVLVPAQVPYATRVNRNVAQSGRLNRAPKKGKVQRKALQNRGFLAVATAAVRRRTELKQFRVFADFTKTHMVPGETMSERQGTGVIVIRPRVRRR